MTSFNIIITITTTEIIIMIITIIMIMMMIIILSLWWEAYWSNVSKCRKNTWSGFFGHRVAVFTSLSKETGCAKSFSTQLIEALDECWIKIEDMSSIFIFTTASSNPCAMFESEHKNISIGMLWTRGWDLNAALEKPLPLNHFEQPSSFQSLSKVCHWGPKYATGAD